MTVGTARDPAEGQVFISYAGPDRAWAEWAAWTLEEYGHRVVLDLWDWRMGERLDERLGYAYRSEVLILLLSPDYLASPWARAEWSSVLAQPATPGRLLPVEVEPLSAVTLPPELLALNRLKISGQPEAEAADRLVSAVRDAKLRLAALIAEGHGPITGNGRTPPHHRPPSTHHTATATAPRLPGAASRPDVSNVPVESSGAPDRESLLEQLRLQLNTGSFACLPPGRGPDGVGPDDIAREYVARFRSQYDLVWWVDAGDAERVRASYAELAVVLGRVADDASASASVSASDESIEELFSLLDDVPRRLIVFDRATAPERLLDLMPPDPGHLLVIPAHPDWLPGPIRRRNPEPPSAVEPRPGTPEPPRPPRILAVATEWAPRRGGLSTFNRRLCQALAAAGAEVHCLVPKFDREEERDAGRHKVNLVEAQEPPVWTGELSLLRRPNELTVVPDVILGHGRISGPAAQLLREQHYPEAQLVHIIHMLPYALEHLKEDREDDPVQRADERTEVELALAESADHVAVVGPYLHSKFARYFPGSEPFSTTLHRLNPGFDSYAETSFGVTAPERRTVPAGDPEVLVFGRAEDVRLKGLDLAAQALGRFAGRTGHDGKLDFVIRGLAAGQSATALRRRIEEQAANGSLNVSIKPYRMESRVLTGDLLAASLVLLPSRSEGFGLSAAEAITAGTPVLVSGASGLALLLRETLGEREAAHHVVETRDDEQDVERWSRAVERVLDDREEAFGRAARLREQLAGAHTWHAAAASLLGRMRDRDTVATMAPS
ncbi:TIR domain-containing protein [Streptomyces sp. NPDC000983]|uniref:TIR domain-containing protein n=1 Tax=Streptomyces sp. NPDC000983 TaxID=3154373 RepID=UPI00332A826E